MSQCYYCGKAKGTTKDHTVPRARGGNVTVASCGKCNQMKATLSVEEFRCVLAYRAGLLPEAKERFKFHFEQNPILCRHGRHEHECCIKCGRGYTYRRYRGDFKSDDPRVA